MNNKNKESALREEDLKVFESKISKASGDLAEVMGRSFERLEERLDATETRIYCRLADIEQSLVKAANDRPD